MTQLIELDRELAGLDFLADYKLPMRGELVLGQVSTFDYLRRHPEQFPNLSADGNFIKTSASGANHLAFDPQRLVLPKRIALCPPDAGMLFAGG